MDWWHVGLVANAVIAVAYLMISAAITIPLVRGRQLRQNPLGGATAAIFLTCGVHHGAHTVHMLLPAFDSDAAQGLAMRQAWDWSLGTWDIVGAVVAVYYWSLRRSYGPLTQSAKLFDDLRERERQALELNDTVLQSLVVAKMAMDLDRTDQARQALDNSIGAASAMITDLLGTQQGHRPAGLLRTRAAVIAPYNAEEDTSEEQNP